MIKTFKNKGLERFATKGDAKKLSVQNIARVERILTALDSAKEASDMNVPGFRWHALSGTEKGRYAVDASGNWRITFAWEGTDAIDVDLEDYH